uniref:DNA2/NAM7 helicase-like C-terminal domain-containing protein n=1 Tax=Phytophthora ramorum TaxID=164328 RepID=H3HDJ4_PHYRM
MLRLVRSPAFQRQLLARGISASRTLLMALQTVKPPLTSLNVAAASAKLGLEGTLEEVATGHFSESSAFPEFSPMEDTLLGQAVPRIQPKSSTMTSLNRAATTAKLNINGTLEEMASSHFSEASAFPEFSPVEDTLLSEAVPRIQPKDSTLASLNRAAASAELGIDEYSAAEEEAMMHKKHNGGRQRDTDESSVATSPFSLETLETQLAEKLESGAIFSSPSDVLVCFWPGADRLEVLWKGFLMPQDPSKVWQVNSQTQLLNFVNSGLHALTKDNLAPQFVRELGKTDGRGILLIQEMLDLTYSNDAGRQREMVSFQRGLVPFMTMLTMRRMEMVSQHMEEANYVYSFLHTAHVQFFQLYLEHLEQIVERHSIEDRMMSHASFLRDTEGRKYAPLCFTQVCLPFIRLLYMLGNKFKDFIYENAFQEAVNYVDVLTTEWMGNTQESDSPLDSALCLKTMREEVKRLHKMIRRGERGVQTGAALRREAQERSKSDRSEPEPWDVIEVGTPGEAVLSDGSVGRRHDNDHRDVRDIQLLPTTEECLSREPPLLPGNYQFHENAHWLPPGPERWVDTHFRLYREDLCGRTKSKKKDDKQSRIELWEKTGRLPFNGMVALVTYAGGALQVVFCQIVERDLEKLVKNAVEAKALVEALSSQVACIQGLPGSGKSFIGSMLTRIIVEANVSPVLIRYELKLLYEKLDANADAIALALRELDADAHHPTWKSLKWFLETNYPDEYDYFAERSAELYDDDWKIAGSSDILEYWIQGQDLDAFQRRGHQRQGANNWRNNSNVWVWSLAKRRNALAQWVGALRTGRVEELVNAQKAYCETMKKIETVKEQADVEVLKRVQIIGMTTTGVAKNQRKIAAVAPPVVICEEAGEVLEAQLMACLSPACQQLVLIGDHKQLRPHIAEYNLSVESAIGMRFALDVSLFERLVAPTSGLPFWMLTEQHRMRPQISQLIRMLFYPEVRDARETLEYPPLLGVDKNVFFVNHNHPEDGTSAVLGASARSHSNEYEVAYLIATLKYLLQQGYHTRDIAILTPYVGQLMKLRTALRGQFVLELNELDLEEIQHNDDDMPAFEEIRHDSTGALGVTKSELSHAIRAATIDNFQGEEATVILVSLVRSMTNAMAMAYHYTANATLVTSVLRRIRNRLNCWPLMAVVYVLVKDVFLVAGMRVLNCVTWTSRLTLLSTAHNHVHDCKKIVATYALAFAVIHVADVKFKLVPSFSPVAIECVENTLKAREGEPEPDFPITATEHGDCQKESASMGLATIRAVILVLRALSRAAGAVSTMENVLCLVALLATAICAISDARNRSRVDTSVRVSVGRNALHKSFVITYYDNNGKPRGALPGGYIDTPQCPNCKKPIRGLRRYGRVTKRAAIDAAEKNFISHAQPSVKRPPCQKAFEACVALLTRAKGGQGGGDVDIDLSTLPVPDSKFPYLGYFNLLSAQLSLLGVNASIARAEQYARKAVFQFEANSFSQQSREARLMLVQILLTSAEDKLSESVKSEQERKEREEAVEVLTSQANQQLRSLEASPSSFTYKHGHDLH